MILFLFFWYGYSQRSAVIQREFDDDLEQIAVDVDSEASALQLHQVLCDGKPQSAAFCVAGLIATDESFHQLIFRDIQLVCGHIAIDDCLLYTSRCV